VVLCERLMVDHSPHPSIWGQDHGEEDEGFISASGTNQLQV
jgi:hypothetical protein